MTSQYTYLLGRQSDRGISAVHHHELYVYAAMISFHHADAEHSSIIVAVGAQINTGISINMPAPPYLAAKR